MNLYVTVIILAIIALVTSLYFYLYWQYRQRFFVYWTLHWLLLFGKQFFDLILLPSFGLVGPLPLLLVFINQLYILLAASLLLLGTYGFLEEPVHNTWKLGLVAAVILGIVVDFINGTYLIGTMFSMLFMALVMIWSGVRFIKFETISRFGRYMAGGSFLIWGIHSLDHPFLRGMEEFIPWGYILGSFLSLLTALGMLFIYFDKARQDLVRKQGQFRLLAENAKDIIYRCRIHPDLACEYVSPAVEKITGYAPECYYQDPALILSLIHPNYKERVQQVGADLDSVSPHIVYSIVTSNNKIVWLEQQNVLVCDESGRVVAIEGIARDITERKDAESNLWYLNIHDSLTGLYNRLYFEERMSSIHRSGGYESVGIVVFDVEGLKLINDTMGHATGDLILSQTANLISQAYQENDTIARIGGDEFAVILQNCDLDKLNQAATHLAELMHHHNTTKPDLPLGISLGVKVSTDKNYCLFELFKEAENAMYRNRLKDSNIARIAIVNTLGRAIQEKDYVAKDHSTTMPDIMELMGLSLGLSLKNVEDLRQLAFFHDIGKIGIPEHILAKPGPLNKEEMEEMRRHSEIGARIAQTSTELAHLADFILKHHERWDGKGYPLGLKGEEIPLECRILAIADSYDAMTNHRPYRQAMPSEQAMKELRKCSASQFDPSLVELFINTLNEHKKLKSDYQVLSKNQLKSSS